MAPRRDGQQWGSRRSHLALAVVSLVDILQGALVVGAGVEAELGHHRATVGSVVVDVGCRQPLASDARHVALLDVVSLRKRSAIVRGVGIVC